MAASIGASVLKQKSEHVQQAAELAFSELSEQDIDDLETELSDLQTSIRQFLQLMKF